MKRFLKILGIAAAAVLIALIGLSFFVKSYLRGERLKALLVPRIEQVTGRGVNIDSIQVSLFRGIVVKGFSIRGKSGEGDFLSARSLVLDYRLLPLLKKELIIEKLELESPSVRIEKKKDGTYNFSDMLDTFNKREEAERTGGTEQAGGPGFLVAADSLHIGDARLEYRDDQTGLDAAVVADGDFKIAPARKVSESLSGELNIKSAKAAIGGIETNTSGRVDITPRSAAFQLNTDIGKESIKAAGRIDDYRENPVITCDISSKEIDIGKLMAAAGGKEEGGAARGTAKAGSHKGGGSPGMSNLTASGQIRLETARYKEYAVNNLLLKYRYERGFAQIEPIELSFRGGQEVSAAGSLRAGLAFVVGPESRNMTASVMDSLAGKGTIDLRDIAVRRSKIAEAIALFTGIGEMRNPRFAPTRFNFTVRDRKIYFDGKLESPEIKIDPSGFVDFDKRLSVLADMKIAPALTSKLSSIAEIATYVKDKSGWVTVPLKITGTTEKPSVALNKAAVGRQMKKGIGREIEKGILKDLFR
ncbi:MAG: AsmA family protein [Nitrospiraceae bacterium]|nr:AsmA family protein [Nitrospiraceae bacterium]